MKARWFSIACVLIAACRYDSSLGVAKQADVDAPTDAPPPSWRIATTFAGVQPRDMHGVSAQDAWIVGSTGALWHWDGMTLQSAASPSSDIELDAVWAASAILGYAVGAHQDGTPAMLQWDGLQWSSTASPADSALTGVAGLAGAGNARVWSVGHASNFLHRSSSTTAWQRQTGQDIVDSPEDIWVSSNGGDVWVVGSQGIARYRESDTAFVERFDGGPMWGVHGRASNDVWAVGAQGSIRRWNGTAWIDTPSGVTVTLRDVWASAPNEAWAVGDQGTVLRWDGLAWHVDADFAPWDLHGIWSASDSDIFAVGSTGTEGVLVRFARTDIGI